MTRHTHESHKRVSHIVTGGKWGDNGQRDALMLMRSSCRCALVPHALDQPSSRVLQPRDRPQRPGTARAPGPKPAKNAMKFPARKGSSVQRGCRGCREGAFAFTGCPYPNAEVKNVRISQKSTFGYPTSDRCPGYRYFSLGHNE